jgi:PAS domain-containing protein
MSARRPGSIRRAARLAAVVEQNGAVATAEFRYRHEDGSWRWVEAVAQNHLFEPSVAGIVVNYREVTERKRGQRELEKRAYQQAALAQLGQLAVSGTVLGVALRRAHDAWRVTI